VHGVSIEAATLPEGWAERTVAVSDPIGTKGNTGHCIEAHDLAASKLVAGREKDRIFATTLLAEGLVDGAILKERVSLLSVPLERRQSITRSIEITVSDLG
jgi:hypothetical protein